jgi:predicted MFS family arabinose efflux permease
MTGLATAFDWRTAALGASGVAVAALALLAWRHRVIAEPAEHAAAKSAEETGSTFAFLGSRAVWLCFLFFFLITAAFGVIQNFASPILQALNASFACSPAGGFARPLDGAI